jgi:hypothetical protein
VSFLKSSNSWRKKAQKAAVSVVAAAALALSQASARAAEALDQHQMVQAAQDAENERGRPLTFREFVDKVRPGYQWYRH